MLAGLCVCVCGGVYMCVCVPLSSPAVQQLPELSPTPLPPLPPLIPPAGLPLGLAALLPSPPLLPFPYLPAAAPLSGLSLKGHQSPASPPGSGISWDVE